MLLLTWVAEISLYQQEPCSVRGALYDTSHALTTPHTCCVTLAQELCQKIMAGTFNTPDWLSPGARDLLGRMLTVDPEARISLADAVQHPWTRSSGITWELPTYHCYSLPNQHHGAGCRSIRSSGSSSDVESYQQREPSSGGGQEAGEVQLAAQASILEELEGHGYSRNAVMKYLAAGESNYITASYYLLAEARHEAAQKLMPQKPWPFQPVAVSSRYCGSSRSRTASSSAARPASGAGAPSSAARPSSGPAAATAAGAGYTSARPATAVAVTS
jgi:serine/threonine protein kinase